MDGSSESKGGLQLAVSTTLKQPKRCMWVSEQPGSGSATSASIKPGRDTVMADVSHPDPKSEEAAMSRNSQMSWGLG